MRLVFVITGLDTGGAQVMLLKLLERLGPDHFSHVISLTTLGEIGERMRSLGMSVEALGMRYGLPSPLGFLRLMRCLRAIDPDVVHTWMYHADLLGGLAARLAGICAVIWCIRHSDLDPAKTKLRTRLVVRACALLSARLPAKIVFNSRVSANIHMALGYASGKMLVVPNGFDLGKFAPDRGARTSVRQELGLAEETPLVGLMARFDPQKNHRLFFEAAAMVRRRMPKVHFVLAGKGIEPGNENLREMLAGAAEPDCVHLLGLRNDMPRLMAALDVLVSSSGTEAFPNVVGEAMACGVPCVVTDVGDCAYIVGDTGRIVQPDDVHALAGAITDLLGMAPSGRAALGERARKRVAEQFEIGQVVRQYEALYAALAGAGTKLKGSA